MEAMIARLPKSVVHFKNGADSKKVSPMILLYEIIKYIPLLDNSPASGGEEIHR
jgi:hypothetical protein